MSTLDLASVVFVSWFVSKITSDAIHKVSWQETLASFFQKAIVCMTTTEKKKRFHNYFTFRQILFLPINFIMLRVVVKIIFFHLSFIELFMQNKKKQLSINFFTTITSVRTISVTKLCEVVRIWTKLNE